MEQNNNLQIARMRLIETGGRTSQDLGLGRIVGQILVYLYLQPEACPLNELEQDLGLSKASISVAARQLEQLGLVQQVWVKGERKKYYRSAENVGQALQQGLLSIVRQKVNDFGDQLEFTQHLVEGNDVENSAESDFLKRRIERASKLQKRLNGILGNPLVRLLTGTQDVGEK